MLELITYATLLVTMNGLPLGELKPECDIEDPACLTIPSGAVAQAIGQSEDCGDVSASGLADCLGIEVIVNTEGGRLILRTREPGL